MRNTVVLIVLDGWGIGQQNQSNPIYVAKPKTIEYIKSHFPSGALQASGIAVGLPWGEEGNSEVGHLTMGIGKVMYQHYPRISLAIKDGSFRKIEAIENAFHHALEHKSKINIVGLAGEANVHSSFEHLKELVALAQAHNVPYALHLFTDGRDSSPQDAFQTLSQVPLEHIGSLCGRYYAMDRDKHWDFTQKAYQALVGQSGYISPSEIQAHLKKTYDRKLNDEYIFLTGVGVPENAIADNDAVLFFNFREDRMRQIAETFINPYFNQFPVKKFSNLYIASMTQYRDDFRIPVAFPPEQISTSLGKVLAENQRTQLRIAETQKYAHVTFFFNGLSDKPFANEYRVLMPSHVVSRQDDDPIMMAPSITTRLIQAIEEQAFDFILVNYANSDMIAHTGNYDATVKAIEVVDEQLSKVVKTALVHNTTLIITSDHGNAERLFNPLTGEPETRHDASPVPVYLIHPQLQRPKNPADVTASEKFTVGMLADIAPTILDILHIPQPPEMTGQSILKQLLSM